MNDAPITNYEYERLGDIQDHYCRYECKFPCDLYGYCWRGDL